MTYIDAIIDALKQLNGEGHWKEICACIEKNSDFTYTNSNENWTANVRKYIQRHCKITKTHQTEVKKTGKDIEDLFYSVYGLGEGYWGLNSYKQNADSDINPIEKRKIEHIKKDITLKETEKEQIILARKGQGIFREKLIKKYKRCIITGIENKKLLIASHIKPWCSSDNNERLNVDNGLLLSPLYDKLFDSGLITFTTEGFILISSELSDHDKEILNINTERQYLSNISDELKQNIKYHNDNIFLK